MMNMVGNGVDLFGYDLEREILRKKPPKSVAELISAVGAVTVMPNGAVAAHDDHPVNKRDPQSGQGKIFYDKQDKKWRQGYDQHPACEGQPVLFVFEYVQSRKKLP